MVTSTLHRPPRKRRSQSIAYIRAEFPSAPTSPSSSPRSSSDTMYKTKAAYVNGDQTQQSDLPALQADNGFAASAQLEPVFGDDPRSFNLVNPEEVPGEDYSLEKSSASTLLQRTSTGHLCRSCSSAAVHNIPRCTQTSITTNPCSLSGCAQVSSCNTLRQRYLRRAGSRGRPRLHPKFSEANNQSSSRSKSQCSLRCACKGRIAGIRRAPVHPDR